MSGRNHGQRQRARANYCVLLRDEPRWLALAIDGWEWSGRWESNPRLKLGKLGYYHYTTPALQADSSRVPTGDANKLIDRCRHPAAEEFAPGRSPPRYHEARAMA